MNRHRPISYGFLLYPPQLPPTAALPLVILSKCLKPGFLLFQESITFFTHEGLLDGHDTSTVGRKKYGLNGSLAQTL